MCLATLRSYDTKKQSVCGRQYIVVLFGPVKPELGVIPSGPENHSAEHLNFPGGELNVIFLQSNISLRKNQRPVNLGL